MKVLITILTVATMMLPASAQQKTSAYTQKKKKPAAAKSTTPKSTAAAPAIVPANVNGELEMVLTKLDKASAGFRSGEADFVWDQFQSIVQEHDLQKGRVFSVRHEKDTHMAAEIVEPDKKQ